MPDRATLKLMPLLPRFRKPHLPQDRFGFAVVGLGHIANYFLEALKDSPTTMVTTLVSGDPAKAKKLASKNQTTLSYADFDRIVEDPATQAVYLALPVDMHREYTERAAAAGKHVLCEKPMAPNAEDAWAMIQACRQAGVQLSIAYRCPHSSLHQRVRQLVQENLLGPKNGLCIESGFGFELQPGWRDNPAQAGGGSLYDVGIYPLNAARYVLGEDPTAVAEAHAKTDDNGLEREIWWTNVFASGARATCASSYLKKIPDTLRITGERGFLYLAPAFSHCDRYELHGEYRDTNGGLITLQEKTPRSEPSEFRLEAEALAAAVTEGKPLLTPGEDGLTDIVSMQFIYATAGVALR